MTTERRGCPMGEGSAGQSWLSSTTTQLIASSGGNTVSGSAEWLMYLIAIVCRFLGFKEVQWCNCTASTLLSLDLQVMGGVAEPDKFYCRVEQEATTRVLFFLAQRICRCHVVTRESQRAGPVAWVICFPWLTEDLGHEVGMISAPKR
ncbi:hypothetical protein BV25DRAFT_1843351 [Artomyces pyxidatus]|uniref:Uncharacterized protein n=1 Tax=Artomyces pyxidatus TaxID=48021 RepID=A0ACB8SG13_9AGAM|nr:hypothetical protein BV25DRAFT_1843351 [Artomyces pyxidatus]